MGIITDGLRPRKLVDFLSVGDKKSTSFVKWSDPGRSVIAARPPRRSRASIRNQSASWIGPLAEPLFEQPQLAAQRIGQIVPEPREVLVHLRKLGLPLLGVDLEQLADCVR